MHMEKKFIIPGRAVPKARPRVTKRGFTYTPKSTKDFEKLVRDTYISEFGGNAMFPPQMPLAMVVEFGLKPPKSWAKTKRKRAIEKEIFPVGRPDVDNLLKGVQDALNGVAYPDDSQIIAITARKVYTKDDQTKVAIWSINNDSY